MSVPNLDADFYPPRLPERALWHSVFAEALPPVAAILDLAAGDLSQADTDAKVVILAANAIEEAEAYRQAVTAFVRRTLGREVGAQTPVPPPPPLAISLPAGALTSVEWRTRRLVARIKAHPNYTSSLGEGLDIRARKLTRGEPKVKRASALPHAVVELRIRKMGYPFVAIDCRRAGGAWEPMAVAMASPFLDKRPLLVEGQAELREYRVQGVTRRGREGDYSPIVSVWATP